MSCPPLGFHSPWHPAIGAGAPPVPWVYPGAAGPGVDAGSPGQTSRAPRPRCAPPCRGGAQPAAVGGREEHQERGGPAGGCESGTACPLSVWGQGHLVLGGCGTGRGSRGCPQALGHYIKMFLFFPGAAFAGTKDRSRPGKETKGDAVGKAGNWAGISQTAAPQPQPPSGLCSGLVPVPVRGPAAPQVLCGVWGCARNLLWPCTSHTNRGLATTLGWGRGGKERVGAGR